MSRSTIGSDSKFNVTILPQPAYTVLYVVETDGTQTSDQTKIIIHESH